jgi:hypothetical protein
MVLDGPATKVWDGDVDPLDVVFRHLDRWRHLPAYQLERRADIFFSVYLKGVIEGFTGVALEDEIIPELPIKHDRTNQSYKVDYALFAKDRSRVFFVELKTDAASRREGQDTYLETARCLGFRRVLEGVRAILLSTTAHQKYHHLAVALARLGYLSLPSDLQSYVYPESRSGLRSRIEQIVIPRENPSVEVIYVQPESKEGDRCIDFARFAEHVRKHSDPFSMQFAEHLLRWKAIAGSSEPVA